jgi:ribosomal protein S18 acetylase RimI-like enzyme
MTKPGTTPASSFIVGKLTSAHQRNQFNSGNEALDHYLQKQASQDMRRRVSTCFVASCADGRIAGYYTLASSGIYLPDLPQTLQSKLPRYPLVPAVRLGRLAIDREFQGKKLGAALLANALERTLRSDIACFALVVDAKNETTAAFYTHYGFTALKEKPLFLFLPLAEHGKFLQNTDSAKEGIAAFVEKRKPVL